MIKSASGQGATLTEMYAHFNKLHFGGQLATYTVRQDLTGKDGVMGTCIPSERLISLNENLVGGELIGELLHEMIHVAVGHHGVAFAREVERLIRAGETSLDTDAHRRAAFSLS